MQHVGPFAVSRGVGRRLLAGAVAAIAGGLTGCGGDAAPIVQPGAVAGMRVQASATRVLPGQPVTLTAEPVDGRGQRVPSAAVQWLWDHPQFTQGTVDGATLRLISPTPRDVQVTAVSAGHSATVTVRVRYPDAGAILFTSLPRDTLIAGGSSLIGVIAVDSLGRTYPSDPPRLVSSDQSVVRIEDIPGAPRAHAIAPGRATILASYGPLQATTTVFVKAPREVFPGTNVLYPGFERALQARGLIPRSTPLAVDRWLSSDPAVARVSASGVVTAVAPGRATVSAVVGRDTLAALIVVKPTPPPVEYVAVVPRTPCALSRDGGVWCWGSAEGGRLGTTEVVDRCEDVYGGRYPCSLFPVRVQSDERFVAAAATASGRGVCALTAAGAVYCWGQVSNLTPLPVPTPIAPGLRAVALDRNCLLTAEGAVYCWGFLPFSDPAPVTATPRLVPSPVAFRQFSLGESHRCGVTADDVAYCWGDNWAGQLGTGNPTQAAEPSPKQVVGLPATRQIQAGPSAGLSRSTCALDLAGALRCWGEAGSNGLDRHTSVPTLIPGVPPLVALVPGSGEHCGLTASGELWCLGAFLGGGPRRVALPFALRTAVVDVTPSCGIATDGILHCWGYGLLGDGLPGDPGARIARVAWQR